MRRHPAVLVAAGALVVVVAGLVVAGTQSRRHVVGSNYVRPATFVAVVPAGERVCQPGERVPSGAGVVEMRVGTYGRPGPPLELTVRAGGAVVARGRLAAGWEQGDVQIPVAGLRAGENAEVCVRNGGRDDVAFAGGRSDGPGALVGKRAGSGAIRVAYLESRSRSWFAYLPDVRERIGVVRDAFPGGLTLPLFAVLAVLALGGAVAVVVREGSR